LTKPVFEVLLDGKRVALLKTTKEAVELARELAKNQPQDAIRLQSVPRPDDPIFRKYDEYFITMAD